MNIGTIKDSIHGCFNVFPNWPAVWAEQNAPRPDVKYLTLRLSVIPKTGHDDVSTVVNALGEVLMAGNRELTLYIQSFGPGAVQVLCDIDSALERFSFLETLRAKAIAYVRSEPIQDLTGLIVSQYIERASLDLVLRVADTQKDTVGYFDKVQAEGEYTSESGRVIQGVIDIK